MPHLKVSNFYKCWGQFLEKIQYIYIPVVEYSKPCHIQNLGIFRTQDISRSLSRHILAYSERCVRLAYWEICHSQNFAIVRILAYLGPKAYSESCLYGHIQAYSIIIVITTLTFVFHFNLTYFPIKFKDMFFDYNDTNITG